MVESHVGYWNEDSKFPVADWQYEVANGDTRLGYWDWVYAQGGFDEKPAPKQLELPLE